MANITVRLKSKNITNVGSGITVSNPDTTAIPVMVNGAINPILADLPIQGFTKKTINPDTNNEETEKHYSISHVNTKSVSLCGGVPVVHGRKLRGLLRTACFYRLNKEYSNVHNSGVHTKVDFISANIHAKGGIAVTKARIPFKDIRKFYEANPTITLFGGNTPTMIAGGARISHMVPVDPENVRLEMCGFVRTSTTRYYDERGYNLDLEQTESMNSIQKTFRDIRDDASLSKEEKEKATQDAIAAFKELNPDYVGVPTEVSENHPSPSEINGGNAYDCSINLSIPPTTYSQTITLESVTPEALGLMIETLRELSSSGFTIGGKASTGYGEVLDGFDYDLEILTNVNGRNKYVPVGSIHDTSNSGIEGYVDTFKQFVKNDPRGVDGIKFDLSGFDLGEDDTPEKKAEKKAKKKDK